MFNFNGVQVGDTFLTKCCGICIVIEYVSYVEVYVKFEDDSGHLHLIPKEYYSAFEKALTRIEESYDEHGDEDIYYEQLNDFLDYFSKHTLEGEPYYVVLPEDLISDVE